MKMTEHQQRLCQNMIGLIQGYLEGQTDDFYSLVSTLDGAMDASEIKEEVIVSQWNNLWTPLEIRRAIEENNVNDLKMQKNRPP